VVAGMCAMVTLALVGCGGSSKSSAPTILAPVTTSTTVVPPSPTPSTSTRSAPTTTTSSTVVDPVTSSAPPLHPTATFASESCCGTWTGVEPTVIWFSGDSGNIVSSVAWTAWTDQSAAGSGTWGDNNCQPNCANGTVTDYRATIRLSVPSGGQFTQLTEVQSGPHGHSYTYTLPTRVVRATVIASGVCTSPTTCPPPLAMAPGSQLEVQGNCPAGATTVQIFAVASHATGVTVYNGGIGKGNEFEIPVTMPFMGQAIAGIQAECQPGSAIAVQATIEYTSTAG
jgi:hypothetical protein